jgi:hypothetical protein
MSKTFLAAIGGGLVATAALLAAQSFLSDAQAQTAARFHLMSAAGSVEDGTVVFFESADGRLRACRANADLTAFLSCTQITPPR